MGNVSKPDTARDMALIKDYLLIADGVWTYTLTELGMKYHRVVDGRQIPLSSSRMSQIFKKHGIERKRVKKKPSN